MRRRRGSKSDAVLSPHSGEPHDDFGAALARLRDHPASIVSDVLPQLIRQFGSDDTLPLEEKSKALRSLLYAIVDTLSRLAVDAIPAVKETWSTRDRSKGETPQAFASRVYHDHIERGLTTAHVRRADYSLYKALASPYWKKKSRADSPFSKVPTKKKFHDEALQALPKKLTRAQLISLLPREIQEQLRLLHVLEMRKYEPTK